MDSKGLYIKYGAFIGIAMSSFFMLVKFLGWHDNPWLRLFNVIIIAFGIYAVIKKKKDIEGDSFEYFSGFKTGISTGLLATGIFVLFMAIYMFHLDTAFTEKLMATWMKGYNQGPGILLFILLVEGVSSSVILSLTFMQKFKRSRNLA